MVSNDTNAFDMAFTRTLWVQAHSYQEYNDGQKSVFDLGTFVGDLNGEEDTSRYIYVVHPLITISAFL